MHPTLLGPQDIAAYLEAGHWTQDTMANRYAAYAADHGDAIACSDAGGDVTWAELDAITDRLAANLIDQGLARDAGALVQMPSSRHEVILRIALKKAGIIGVFAPMQWRRRELAYVIERIEPSLAVLDWQAIEADDRDWFEAAFRDSAILTHRINLSGPAVEDWLGWAAMVEQIPTEAGLQQISSRSFAFDEVSLITASSGTSGLAKLCEWPEAAQVCIGRYIGQRIGMTADDNVGILSPMSGAAGVLVWLVSATTPATFTFPGGYKATELLELVEKSRITIATTVPVILARLAQEPLDVFDLSALRALRVGTAAADMEAAKSFETQTGCRVVIAAGSMECPGFAHAEFHEPGEIRLNGSIGKPFPGARLRIEDDDGLELPHGEVGELKITAPYAASGYWRDPETTGSAWKSGWYATGDFGLIDGAGRLRLKGRLKEIINRSGLKILPAEIEQEIAGHPDIFECAVVKAQDPEYGEVPWAFVHLRPGRRFDSQSLISHLKGNGLAGYKIPTRFIPVQEFPRVSGSKIDKKKLLEMAPPP